MIDSSMLTAAEAYQFKGARMCEKLELAYDTLPPTEEFIAAALAGAAKRGWYRHAHAAIWRQYGADGPRFSALLAALSPRVSLQTNAKNAMAVWTLWEERGSPTDKRGILNVLRSAISGELLRAWVPNTYRALGADSDEDIALSGPKVASFFANLTGDAYEVTCDAWIATFAGIEQRLLGGKVNGRGPGKTPYYVAVAVKVREAARALAWSPAEVQECIWSWTKTAYEYASAQGLTIDALVRSNAVTDKMIGATPDFHTLIAANQDYAAPAYLVAGTPDLRDHLLRAAARLDIKLFAARVKNEEPNF